MPSIAAQLRAGAGVEVVEAGVAEGRQDLARAVGAEVQAEEAVAVAGARVAVDHGGGDEFVASRRGRRTGRRRLRRRRRGTLGMDDGVVGARHPLPPVVAVHRPVAAR